MPPLGAMFSTWTTRVPGSCAAAGVADSSPASAAAAAGKAKKRWRFLTLIPRRPICIKLSQSFTCITSGETATTAVSRMRQIWGLSRRVSSQPGFQLLAGFDQALHRLGGLGEAGLLVAGQIQLHDPLHALLAD